MSDGKRIGMIPVTTTTMAATSAQATMPGSRVTREYINASAQTDAFERLEATTVLAQTETPAVRAFANRMLTEHDASSQKLMQAVAQAGLEPPTAGISGDQSSFLAALQSARGAAFDRLYARQQALAHRAALATQESYVSHGDIRALTEFATSNVELVKAHIASADRLVAELGGD